MADRLSTSDDGNNSEVNGDEDIESSNKDIKSDNEEVVFIDEQCQERQEFLPLERSKSRKWEHFGFLARDGKIVSLIERSAS